jgi:hypothetical protein
VIADVRWEQHANGVHVNCRLAPLWAGVARIGENSPDSCRYAGQVARFHGHDYDGPLVCGCEELGI